MTKITMMMVMMMALVLLIGVRAKTMTESECKGTDCKFDCKGLNCMWSWVNGMYWNPRMCYYGCSGPCGRDLNCRQRCKKCCHWHTPGASSTMN
ncbi:hypothetical protein CARUB_v10021739mg [Capsella rubella]|uniref:Embryo surrounding factor 1 brassicaceae domain-containing protein n=1 Tax=Capsella rubella TaxID=81985 RepID=R0IC52_9BRAS|nr:hypothetical protein CARUB_v10021739mg [Capsella rubella]